jgi:hypothetical protein
MSDVTGTTHRTSGVDAAHRTSGATNLDVVAIHIAVTSSALFCRIVRTTNVPRIAISSTTVIAIPFYEVHCSKFTDSSVVVPILATAGLTLAMRSPGIRLALAARTSACAMHRKIRSPPFGR